MSTRRYARLAAVATAAVLAAAAAPAAAAEFPSGPDVASWQHPAGVPIDWTAVRAGGQSFAFVKATEGATYTNPYFAADWAGARAAGLYRGAYHFARPGVAAGDALAEAGAFAAVIGAINRPGDLPPVLDLESNGGLTPAELADWTATFLTAVESATGRTPILYTYPTFWAASMAGSAAFTRYPLWIAHLNVTAPTIGPWANWTFWQHSSTGTVAGIAAVAGTDLNRFNGTAAELAGLALVPAGAGLSLTASPATVRYGADATVSGQLRGADGGAVAGAQIKLQQRRIGTTAWSTLASVPTAADGTYRHTFHPYRGMELVARSAATEADPALASPVVTMRVAAAVSARWSDGAVPAGTVVQLRGAVYPHPAGTVVFRQVWRYGHWSNAAKATADSSGRFAFAVPTGSATPRLQRVVTTPAGYATGTYPLPRLQIS